jgi:para-nitrobenzyl esterase
MQGSSGTRLAPGWTRPAILWVLLTLLTAVPAPAEQPDPAKQENQATQATLPAPVLPAAEVPADTVQLTSGPVRGKIEGDVRVFLGIPYAASPTGPLRWRAPQELTPWTETRESTSFGPSCPQPGMQADGRFSEDCLYLNVWSKPLPGEDKAPVMVWIHGGAFNFGSGSLPEYEGSHLARKGVVVVTINYRLGPLGFLAHPLLAGESAQGVAGNYGLLDQLAALAWVRTNIAAFGGDPGRITIFGQSAGSRSVNLLLLSPLAAGLFHRAIASSGGPIIGSEYLHPVFNGNPIEAAAMSEKLAAKLGCATAPDVLAALRAQPVEAILAAADCTTPLFGKDLLFFAPVFDGWILPKNPRTALKEGRQHDVPIIVGSTRNEGSAYLADTQELPLERYQDFLHARFGDLSPEAQTLFPAATAAETPRAIDRVITVGANAQPARFVARSMARKQSKAYLYQFARRPGTAKASALGVYHGADLAYIFGTMEPALGYDDTDRALSQTIMDYWTQFARSGDPNGPGRVEWPAYTSQNEASMEFSDTVQVQRHVWEKECDFIDRVPHYRED